MEKQGFCQQALLHNCVELSEETLMRHICLHSIKLNSCWCLFLLLFKRIRQNWFCPLVQTRQLNFEHRVELTDETLLPSQQQLSFCWWEEGCPFLLLFHHKKWPWRSWTQEARRRGANLGMNGIICPDACCFSACRFLLRMVLFSWKPNKIFMGPNLIDSVKRRLINGLSQCMKIASSTLCELICLVMWVTFSCIDAVISDPEGLFKH